ncbi:MAG: AMP-binding protein [Chloroflexota bacterium]|nr:AMP-binding protein [Dehalococcoidia bacterium]MDW8254931.1 AMP-binding protein [Chloroflexota bacterium]
MNLCNAVHAIARRDPHRPAIVEPTRTTTYRELAERISALAAGLARRGIRRGDRVAIALGNRREHLEAILAAVRLGAAALPVDAAATPAEIADVAERFSPAALVAERPLGGWPSDRLLVTLEDGTYDALLSGGGDADLAPASDDPCFVMLSSGTTGKPKGAVVTHAAMAFRFLAQVITFRFSADDRYLNLMPLHTGGGRSFTLSHLYLGATVWLPGKFDAAAADRLVREAGITTACVVPTMLHRIVAAGGGPWPTMRALISSGAPLPAADRDAVLRQLTPNLYDYYASVEAGGVAALGPGEHAAKPGSVGRPMWGIEVRLAGAARPGEVGEIWYRSPGMIAGYAGLPPDEAFSEGWYRTGDLGRFDEDGFLFLVGRSKEVIISGGVNVYPAEVEAALREIAAVADAAVLGLPDPDWGERVVAAVVPAPGSPADAEAILTALRGRLSGPKRPKQIVFLDSLPRNRGGKVDTASLRALIRARAEAGSAERER